LGIFLGSAEGISVSSGISCLGALATAATFFLRGILILFDKDLIKQLLMFDLTNVII